MFDAMGLSGNSQKNCGKLSFKTTPVGDIPADILKFIFNVDLLLTTKIVNLSFENNCFPEDLKLAEVSPVFKKDDDLDKENYRLVNVVFHVPKVFERIVYS